MATFIPGITDVYPQPIDFKVDYNQLERSLALNDAAYEQGARRLRSLYDSIFNSTLQRDDNIKNRDAYLKQISGALKSIASTDLSQMQNRASAYKLFDPISSDPLMAKDMVFSKTLASEYSKAMSYRNSSDPAVRRQFWETGLKAMNYQVEEFRNAGKDEAIGMSSPRYISNIDFIAMGDKLFKESGISVKVDEINGGYIWTKKNGEVAYDLTQGMLNSMLGNDPAVMDFLKTKAYVQRKDFVKQNALKYGSEEMAEQAYFDEVLKGAAKKNEKLAFKDTDELKKLRTEKESWDKVIETKGISTIQDREKYLSLLDKIQLAEQAAIKSQNSLGAQQFETGSDIILKRNATDNIIATANFLNVSETLAKYLAFKNAEITAKADPISLANLRNQLSIQLEGVRQFNRKELEGIKHDNRIKEIQERGKFNTTKPGGGTGSWFPNLFSNPSLLKPEQPNSDNNNEDEDEDISDDGSGSK